ncbi:MAG: hypothetical protein K2L96_06355 [Muribaculaceae bacterium]|nr:hypothetical protein [Muribaculaceae bacterium]
MNTIHVLKLEATGTFHCKMEDGSFYAPSKIIEKGTQISINVPKAITKTTIFSLPDKSKYIDDIISQFHENKLMISKNQLASGYWKVIEDLDNTDSSK